MNAGVDESFAAVEERGLEDGRQACARNWSPKRTGLIPCGGRRSRGMEASAWFRLLPRSC